MLEKNYLCNFIVYKFKKLNKEEIKNKTKRKRRRYFIHIKVARNI